MLCVFTDGSRDEPFLPAGGRVGGGKKPSGVHECASFNTFHAAFFFLFFSFRQVCCL